jgi:hypothetical protein
MKDEIIFFSSVPGLAEAFPIVHASKMMPTWMTNAFKDFKDSNKELKENKWPSVRRSHIAKCPGIVKLMTTGYIVPLWHDAVIEVDSTRGRGFEWTVPSEALTKDIFTSKALIENQPDHILKHLPRTWNQSNNFMKINTPWSVVAPQGVKLLFNPISYPDNALFDASIGFLDTDESTEVNIQGWWNVPHGSQLFPAGYPLVHIIPITERKLELVVRDANQKDNEWLEKKNYINSYSFDRTATYKNLFMKILRKYF